MERKILIVVRHAHRDKALGHEVDNGISPKGRAQAQQVAQFFRRVFPDATPRVISSPKLRCIETVEPLARQSGSKVDISPLLDEGDQLKKRSKAMLDHWLDSGDELTVICSHGDWIPVFLEKTVGLEIDLDKGAWAQIEEEESGKLKLTTLVQDFSLFG